MGKRIVLHTLGSLGDLHPFMALALELRARGHSPVIATSETYRGKIEAEGIDFSPTAPDLVQDDENLARQIMDVKHGPEFVLRKVIFPVLRDTYQDLLRATTGADLLISAAVTYAAPLVAEKTGIRWIATAFAPLQFWSAYDPPVPPPYPYLAKLRVLGPGINRWVMKFGKSVTEKWIGPILELRKELGLNPPAQHPIFEGQFSPTRNLALFSSLMGSAQPDWPKQAVLTGFVFYDRAASETSLSPKLAAFLDAGSAPIVFTLGSAAVKDAGNYFVESVAAAKQLGRRAVLLIGDGPQRLPSVLGSDIIAVDYAPFSEVFPRAVAVVHQGGIGTCGQALRAGRPMVVVPFSHDQPDNAARLERLGVARVVRRNSYTADRIATTLTELLGNAQFAVNSARAGKRVLAEDGITRACSEIEQVLTH